MSDKNDNIKKGTAGLTVEMNAMVEALIKTLGIVTTACKLVGISRQTHYRWLSENADYKTACDDVTEIALDFAESALHTQIQNGEVSSTIFYLKTKGKKRGFVERNEIVGADGQPLNVKVEFTGDISDLKTKE